MWHVSIAFSVTLSTAWQDHPTPELLEIVFLKMRKDTRWACWVNPGAHAGAGHPPSSWVTAPSHCHQIPCWAPCWAITGTCLIKMWCSSCQQQLSTNFHNASSKGCIEPVEPFFFSFFFNSWYVYQYLMSPFHIGRSFVFVRFRTGWVGWWWDTVTVFASLFWKIPWFGMPTFWCILTSWLCFKIKMQSYQDIKFPSFNGNMSCTWKDSLCIETATGALHRKWGSCRGGRSLVWSRSSVDYDERGIIPSLGPQDWCTTYR